MSWDIVRYLSHVGECWGKRSGDQNKRWNVHHRGEELQDTHQGLKRARGADSIENCDHFGWVEGSSLFVDACVLRGTSRYDDFLECGGG